MTRLREHIEVPVDEARLERQWSALRSAGLPSAASTGHKRALWWMLSGALAMAAVGALALQLRATDDKPSAPVADQLPQSPQLPVGAVLESDETEVAVQLSDGSRVALAPRAQMRVRSNRPKVVELELRAGQAHFDVRHDTERRFAIRLGEAEVRVLGTRFDLLREERPDGTYVRVSVRQGVVEVERTGPHGEIARIHEKESWSAVFPRPEQNIEPEQVPEPEVAAPEELLEESTPAESTPEQAAPRLKAKAQRSAQAAQAESDASALFGQASLARRAGRMREAAGLYGELLVRYPRDPRAGLSAFELGRLRMDALNDQAGAIDALERALKSSTSASFREDALARIVVASDALGRTQQCLRARARYTEHYPNGVHGSALAQRCK